VYTYLYTLSNKNIVESGVKHHNHNPYHLYLLFFTDWNQMIREDFNVDSNNLFKEIINKKGMCSKLRKGYGYGV
jgi:hypothetical protein